MKCRAQATPNPRSTNSHYAQSQRYALTPLLHEETQRMCQNDGGDTHNVPSQTAPVRAFQIKDRTDNTEHGFDALANPSENLPDFFRPLLFLIDPAQG